MYLKELILRGFKSFASATTLRFEPGITAVVGPNGSGKSNIVDALTWVMGEQGAKNLRGTSMEDVIFAGTSSRQPLGRAQVMLTIDNTDHTLNIDYSEVTISRTIFRNGGSEYAINGSTCRLLDIQELLSDTGLGQQMHVIVGQGRLDAILRADPSGHRAFIEEAAGILKHRKRKERALRKLANTQANLSRLDDLLGELHRQLGPLGRQARISKRAEGIQAIARDAQSRLYAQQALETMRARDAVRTELTSVRTSLSVQQRQLAKTKLQIEQIEALTSQTNPTITKINQSWHELSRIEERLRSLSSIAGERARSLRGQITTNFGEDPELLERRASELERQAEQQQHDLADMRLQYDHAVEERANIEKQLAAVRQTITEVRKASQQRDSRIANLRELVAREESSVQLAETRKQDFEAQHDALLGQLVEARHSHDEIEQRRMRQSDDDGQALEKARASLQERQNDVNEVEERLRSLNSTIISLRAKADALNDTLESRNASGALERDPDISSLGALTAFIHVEDGWEEAVAHALGAYASATVVPTATHMMHALARAKDDRLGKAVLLHPLDDNLQSQPHIEAGTESRQFTQMQPQDELHHDSRSFSQPAETRATATKSTETLPTETHMCAARLVSANTSATDTDIANRVVAAVRYLLRDIAVAQTKESALSMLAEGSWRQVVTKDGEVISRVGAVGGSSLSQSNLSLAARRDKALQQVSKLDDETQELQSEVTQAHTLRDEARLALDHAAQQRTEERLKAQQSERELKSSAGLVSDLEHRVNGVEAKMKTCADEGETHRLKLDDLRRALQSMQESTSEEADVDELSERERSLSSSLAATREQEITMKIAWNEANHQVESLHRQAGLLHDNAKDAVRRRERMETLNTLRQEQAEHIERVGKQAEQIAGIVHRSVEEVVARREELQHSASVHDDELKTLRAQRNEIEPEVAHLQGREHELDVDRERMAAQYGQLTQKVSDDLGLSLEELVRDFGPEKPVPVLDDNGQPVLLDDDGLEPKKTTETGRINGVEPTDAVESINSVERTDAQNSDERHQETKSGQEIDAQAQVKTVPYVKAEQLKRLEKAQRDLKALGKINPLATEEYDALQTRNQYLHDQRNDIAQSRDDLMKLIKDLDATMVEVFTSAFADTARAFEKVFATLFPGGTGRLRLENPDDPLTTGVIVEASPAGKRVKQLSLLSGGERSLTALALLFAIFTARPSPFYVMDEVEAALDDVNLTRLLNALNDLREHAQLIIITHQQRTISIADALYGVTMRSDGVTAVMSQKLAHGKSD